MSQFEAEAMTENLSHLFEDSYVSVEQDRGQVRVTCAELGTRKCRSKIEEAFDDSGGLVSGLMDKFIGADVVVYEDFDIDEEGDELVVYEK